MLTFVITKGDKKILTTKQLKIMKTFGTAIIETNSIRKEIKTIVNEYKYLYERIECVKMPSHYTRTLHLIVGVLAFEICLQDKECCVFDSTKGAQAIAVIRLK